MTNEILKTKLKQASLVTKSDLNAVSKHADKNEEQIKNLETFHLSYCLGKNFLGDVGFQNMFFYQTTCNTLGLREGKCTDYAIG